MRPRAMGVRLSPRLHRLSPAVAVAGAVFAVAALALGLTHHARPLPVPRALAARAALADPPLRVAMAQLRLRPTRLTVTALDDRLDHVQLWAGDRTAGEVSVDRSGAIVATGVPQVGVPYGDWIGYEPPVLAGLAGLFVLMTAVAPWRRLRNLDVLATLSLLVPVVVLEHALPIWCVLSGIPGLLFLGGRAAWVALGPQREPAPGRLLWELACARLAGDARVRVLRIVLVALVFVFVLVGVSSPKPVDVIFAVMEGATRLIHGVLPYGHMPGDVVHGDTYPLLTYVLYAPVALLAPVHTSWCSVDGGLAVGVAASVAAAAAAALLAVGLARRPAAAGFAAVRSARREDGARREEETGLRAAIALLAFPPLLVTVSTGTTDVVLAVLLALTVLLWRRPVAASAMLSVAAWFKLAPAALIPFALAPLRGRRLAAAAAAPLAVSVPCIALLLALGGTGGVPAMLHAIAYQFSRGSLSSPWAALGIESLQPLGQAAVLALVAGAAWRLRSDRALAADRGRVAALVMAVLVGLQLAADYWSFLYLAWFAPLLVTGVLGSTGEPVALPAPATVPPPATLPAPA